jgi:undecaprenyl diphosphate synthase
MDGNGRWAQARGLPRMAGHRAGTENIRRVLEGCVEFGVKTLTIYAFSTENWGRPRAEVLGLIHILGEVIDRETKDLHRNGVQLRHIGRLEGIPARLQKKVRQAIELTLLISLPMLGVGMAVGVIVSVIQAATQIQEMTLTMVPKIVAIFLALLIAFPWIMDKMVTYTRELFLNLPNYIR